MTFKLIKTGAAAIALLAIPVAAVAADMRPPVYKGVPRSVVSYYNWSGFYVGATVGYGTGTSTWDYSALGLADGDVSPKGMMYGITLGYNWQAGSFVYGVEADYNFSSVTGSAACLAPGFTCETSNSWLATFRGRVGYAFDRLLPYVTVGGAYGDIRARQTLAGVTVLENNESRLGFAIGAGVEYAFLANWTAKLEYLYVDLGSFEVTPLVPVSLNQHIFRAGLNYRF
jgi:outer membrane immunogenic protein